MSSLKTEYSFVLHKGYVDEDGEVHTRGVMRLATARDEIEPLRDPRIAGPEDPMLTLLVLSRVIVQLGGLDRIDDRVVGGLFAADLAYLQDFYGVVNFGAPEEIEDLLAAQQERVEAARRPIDPEPVDEDPDAAESDEEAEAPVRTVSRRRASIEEVPADSR